MTFSPYPPFTLDQLSSYIDALNADPYPNPDYSVIRTESDLDTYWRSAPSATNDLGLDTESRPGTGTSRRAQLHGDCYCLTYSHTPGTGRLIYHRDTHLIHAFAREVDRRQSHILLHNYLHDVVPLTSLSIPIPSFTDTMVRAYNLCLGGGGDDDGEGMAGRGSLGLKILAFRLLNMRMTSFKDTVFPIPSRTFTGTSPPPSPISPMNPGLSNAVNAAASKPLTSSKALGISRTANAPGVLTAANTALRNCRRLRNWKKD